MGDLYFREIGDLAVSTSGDLAATESMWRDVSQQAYIRVMTDPGDFQLYPNLGADLSRLYGMPQAPETAEIGKALIRSALDREGRFQGYDIYIDAQPSGPQSIKFEILMTSANGERLNLTITQDLESILIAEES